MDEIDDLTFVSRGSIVRLCHTSLKLMNAEDSWHGKDMQVGGVVVVAATDIPKITPGRTETFCTNRRVPTIV